MADSDSLLYKDGGYVNIISTLGQNNNAKFFISMAEDIQYKTVSDFDSEEEYNQYLSDLSNEYRSGSVQAALDTANTNINSINTTITEIEGTEIPNINTSISTINNYIYSLQTKVSDLEDNIGDLIKVKTVTIKASNWTNSNAYFYTPTDNTLVIVRPTEGCSEDMYDAIARANFEIGYYNDNTELGLVSRSLLPTIDITLDFIEIPLSTSS